ncbi:Uncharacterised protein [Escherichia coli]|uniref:Uncharacterized protein n=1 Tax=Escherichia coli TaxID=562 RepID=A0A376TNX3_ECOLX|nr:hypothetical protein HmCmsJML231_03893 [Escherichia coli]GDE11216.1 hypothetical protein HmCmsJML293_04018 [Escherichia coli]STI78189.1 Uncharacterised protein [Escherichia coli]
MFHATLFPQANQLIQGFLGFQHKAFYIVDLYVLSPHLEKGYFC